MSIFFARFGRSSNSTSALMNRARFAAIPIIATMVLFFADHSVAQAQRGARGRNPGGVKVGPFAAEVLTVHTTKNGLPDDDVLSVAVTSDGHVYAGTSKGLTRLKDGQWQTVDGAAGPVKLIAAHGKSSVVATVGNSLVRFGEIAETLAPLPATAKEPAALRSLAVGKTILLGTNAGLFELAGKAFVPVAGLSELLHDNNEIHQVAASRDGRIAVASPVGLFVRTAEGSWQEISPAQNSRSWAPRDVRGVAFDARDRLWFCSPQGAGCLEGAEWSLYTGQEGLPYNDFTTMAAGEAGAVWFGTNIGAIRRSDAGWNYRQGRHWLPDDVVRNITVDAGGNAWFATAKGVGVIERRPMTLANKAKFFEDEIDKYNRRTPYGYVLGANLKTPGDKSESAVHDSDNDGLWTSMYGAGECFSYAATKDPQAKARATKAFEAVAFLSEVTQGGSHPAPHGFPARTIRPTSGPDPNKEEGYSAEKDFLQKFDDPLWKVIVPRWPTSADGKWFWKTDTSSDELDGHYFLYSLYYDLVAETDQEKARAREVVARVTDHLLAHEYNLVDHDGKPTRWGIFGPKYLGGLYWTAQRGLNSLSILSYLKVAEHVTGDLRYTKAYKSLAQDHGYAGNVQYPKVQTGRGTGNQSDDEMAFMCYYHLIKYENDPRLRSIYLRSLWGYWSLEEPERCPLFNYIFASLLQQNGRFFPPPQSCLDDAADTLRRIPLDRVRWGYKNSHRTDVELLSSGFTFFTPRERRRGHLVNGKVVPIDERFVDHWNQDPWTLDEDGGGTELADGASFLLPYYMGLYYKFLIE